MLLIFGQDSSINLGVCHIEMQVVADEKGMYQGRNELNSHHRAFLPCGVCDYYFIDSLGFVSIFE